MREVINEIETWRREGKSIAIATNVKREGSSLRPLGAKMAMTPAQEIAGSVTGGCIEGAVYEEALEVLQTGKPKRLRFSATHEDNPWDVGLSCGGSLDVLVETLESHAWRAIYPPLKTSLERNQMVAVVTVISGEEMGRKMLVWPDGRTVGGLGSAALEGEGIVWAQGQMRVQESGWATLAGVEVFGDVLPPLARLVIIGAVHVAIPLVTLAKAMGFRTVVIDPRGAFATPERFPHVDELMTEWPADALEKLCPDEGTYIAVLSHDEKLDNPALKVALSSPARYVGVLGARKKLPQRLAALRALGVAEEELPRLCAPIGLNLGAVLPEEIALSILGEMIAARHGRLTSEVTAVVS